MNSASPKEIYKEMDSVDKMSQKLEGNVDVKTSKEAEDECQNSLHFQTIIPKKVLEESDPHRIKQRQKQIEYGKNTLGYKHYIQMIPREQRKEEDPQTPDVKQVCSKRSWDGQIIKWRRLLHHFDEPPNNNQPISVGSRKCDSPENHYTIIASKNKPKNAVELLHLYQQWVAKKP